MDDLTEALQGEYQAAAVWNPDRICHPACAQNPEIGGKCNHDGACTDPKGRQLAETMADRAIAVESLILLRAFGDALQALGDNPMLRALPGMRGMFSTKQ